MHSAGSNIDTWKYFCALIRTFIHSVIAYFSKISGLCMQYEVNQSINKSNKHIQCCKMLFLAFHGFKHILCVLSIAG
jgi:hypothetical protein